MNIALGIFDIFAYAVPGALYMALLWYVVERLDLVAVTGAVHQYGLLAVIGLVVASYLLGHLSYEIGRGLERHLPGKRYRAPEAREETVRRIGSNRSRPDELEMDISLLFAALEQKFPETAIEVSRLRAAGITSRSCTPVFVLAFGLSVVEIFVSERGWFALGCAAFFGLASVAALRHGRELFHWANLHTLEGAYWAFAPRSRN
jgi:hypothetical protein